RRRGVHRQPAPQRRSRDHRDGAATSTRRAVTGAGTTGQPFSHELIDPANTGLGHRHVQRWTLPDGWIISTRLPHPALVSEEDFVAVQGIRAERDNTGTTTARQYLLAGLLRCGIRGGGWSRAGRTTGPPTGAVTAIPAPSRRTRPGRRTPTSARSIPPPVCRRCTPASAPPSPRLRGDGAAPGRESRSRARSARRT